MLTHHAAPAHGDDARPGRPRPPDLLVAGGALLLSLSLAARFLAGLEPARSTPLVTGLLLHSLAPAWIPVRPLPAFFASLAGGALVVAGGLPTVTLGLSPLLATWYLAAWASAGPAAVGVGTALVLASWASAFREGAATSTTLSNLLAVGAAGILGRQAAQRRARMRALQDRAEALARAATAEAERAVVEERLRIAREMHDVVAHGLGAITVQAGAAAHVDLPAETAHRILETIEQLSRRTTDELRGVLQVLRGDGAVGHAPVPEVAGIDDLVEGCRRTGMAVDLVVAGTPREVGPMIGLALHRVVQEALTNVRRHAGPATATVTVRWGPDAVEVTVQDDGAGGAADGPGLGLVGMRERVASCGGRLHAGPAPGGRGFVVRAVVPAPSAAAPREVTT